MDEDTKTAIDERVRWVDAVVADATKRGPVAIKEAIDDLDPDHLPGIVFMLMFSRVADRSGYGRSCASRLPATNSMCSMPTTMSSCTDGN